MDSASSEDELRRLLACTCELSKSLDEEMKSSPVGSFLGRKLPPILLARSLELVRHMKRAIKLMTASKEQQEPGRLPTLVVHEAEKDHKLLHHEEANARAQGKKELDNIAIENANENLDGKRLLQHAAAADGAAAGCAKLVRKRRRPLWKKSVHVTGDNPDLGDGFIWRKYGEKTIQGASYRRSYYRCTHKAGHGCPAMKHVQKSEDDVLPAGFDVTYIDFHTCGSQPLIPFVNSAAPYNMNNYNHPNRLHDFTTNAHLSTSVASYNHPSFSAIINDQLIPNSWPLLGNYQPNLVQISNTSTSTASIKPTTIDPSDPINDCMNSSMSYTDHDFLLQTTGSRLIRTISPTNSLVISSTSPASSSEAISSPPPFYQNLHAEFEVISFMSNTPGFSPSPDLISSNPFAFYDEWQISDKPGQPYN